MREHSYLLGQCTSADDAYLALRGLRTMPARLKQHEQSAMTVAKWLDAHPLVDHVRHPAFETCPGHEFFKRDFDGSNGLFSIVMKEGSQKAINRFLDALSHFKMGFSWGDTRVWLQPIKPWSICDQPQVGHLVPLSAFT